MPEHRVHAEQRRFARRLRTEQTSLEDLLWRELRGRQLDKWKFRRQVPLEGYVVDFFCTAARLSVEADGPHHNTPEQRAIDMHRDAVVRQHGVRVLRFSRDSIFRPRAGSGRDPACAAAIPLIRSLTYVRGHLLPPGGEGIAQDY